MQIRHQQIVAQFQLQDSLSIACTSFHKREVSNTLAFQHNIIFLVSCHANSNLFLAKRCTSALVYTNNQKRFLHRSSFSPFSPK
jgi:hypothetical protein